MLRNSLIKFITAVLFFASMVVFYINPVFEFVLYIMICLAIVRFFVTMILEPDSIWEIIKKFIYVTEQTKKRDCYLAVPLIEALALPVNPNSNTEPHSVCI